MTDTYTTLVKLLAAINEDDTAITPFDVVDRCHEAAEAIATLQSQLAEAREALRNFADKHCEGWCDEDPKACEAIGGENCSGCPLRAALKEQSHDD
jgi:hypothetical protein